ncbi:branched-chain amino acid transport system substrate-binding protein [Desulfosoma caldarium]|uniref:Branched-chain amino acid transport system substrate-binding protein n=2 Tax=Desulfosoma caldarium TaxID=610254 RepID=A0A3N1VFG6_9BACT|nr:branched-chain amino acid transport system substrate-binding protein [Desulfosoma caldarium]
MGILLCFLVSWGPLKGCSFKDPVRVGFVGPLTGRFSDLGIHGRNGAMLAVEAVNASGGVQGRSLELILANDQGTVSGALASVQRLLSQGLRVFLGPMTSTQVLAVLPTLEQANAVCLSPTASSQVLDDRADALFRMAPSDAVQVEALAKHILLNRHARTVVIVWDADNEAFARAYAEGFAEAFRRRGGIVLAQHAFRSSRPSVWKPMLQPLEHAGSEAILVVASAKDTAYLCQWLAKKGIRAAVFTSFWARSPELVVYGGRTVEGVELVSAVNVDPETSSLQMKDFVKAYRHRFGKDPNHAAVFSYEAVLLLRGALERSLSGHLPLPTALTQVHDIVGPTGPLRLTPFGDRHLPCVMERVAQGRFHVLSHIGETR